MKELQNYKELLKNLLYYLRTTNTVEQTQALIEKLKSDVNNLLRTETSDWKQKKLQELNELLENYGKIRIPFREETDLRKKAVFALALKRILLRIHGLYKGLFAEKEKAKLRTNLIKVATQKDVTADNKDLALLGAVVGNPPT